MLATLSAVAMMSAVTSGERPYLDAARKAALWIKAERPRQSAERKADAQLYGGSAGVLLFYCELAHTTGDPSDRKVVEELAREVASSAEKVDDAGLYTG